MWLDYDGQKPFTATQLARCHTWRDINELFALLRASWAAGHPAPVRVADVMTVGLLVNVASSGECWRDAAVDWVVTGLKRAGGK